MLLSVNSGRRIKARAGGYAGDYYRMEYSKRWSRLGRKLNWKSCLRREKKVRRCKCSRWLNDYGYLSLGKRFTHHKFGRY